MRKNLTLVSLSLFVLSLTFLIGGHLNAQEKKSDPKALKVVEQMIEAQGGRKLLESIKDMTVSGTMELPSMGMEGTVTLHSKEPNKIRLDIEVMGMLITQAYDGEIAWMTNPQTGATEEMPENLGDALKRDAMGNDALLNPKKYGITFSYKGTEKIEDKDHHVLIQTYDDGYQTTLYIDAKTHLLYKTSGKAPDMMGMEVDTETFQTDYKKIQGMMMAQTMTQYQDGEEFMVMTVTDVKINTGLEDSLFKME